MCKDKMNKYYGAGDDCDAFKILGHFKMTNTAKWNNYFLIGSSVWVNESVGANRFKLIYRILANSTAQYYSK